MCSSGVALYCAVGRACGGTTRFARGQVLFGNRIRMDEKAVLTMQLCCATLESSQSARLCINSACFRKRECMKRRVEGCAVGIMLWLWLAQRVRIYAHRA